MSDLETIYADELEVFDEFEQEEEWEYGGNAGWSRPSDGPFSEGEEMELAAELLTVADDEELEEFLGDVMSKALKGAKKFANSSVGRALGKVGKGLIKKALPIAGGALGGVVGGPAGARIGSSLGSFAGKAFGLELEGLSPEDQEFEVARRAVRLVGDAAKKAARTSTRAPAPKIAKAAFAASARKHAPGLTSVSTTASGGRRSGRWVRRGHSIVLVGA